MAFVHGKTTAVFFDEYNLSAYLNAASVTKQAQAVRTTVFGLDDHTYAAGLEEGSVSFGGLYDGSASAVDEVLNTALNGTSVVSVSWPGADTIGQAAAMLQAKEASYQIRVVNNDMVRITGNATADTGARFGIVLKDHAAETSPGNFSSVDNSASTANGAVGQLHVTAFTGTNATIKITDSTDDAVFSDLITFTTVTDVTSERGTVAGTVNRYARVELTGTFTTITFIVSFVRNLQ
jgi:hypothetical protein